MLLLVVVMRIMEEAEDRINFLVVAYLPYYWCMVGRCNLQFLHYCLKPTTFLNHQIYLCHSLITVLKWDIGKLQSQLWPLFWLIKKVWKPFRFSFLISLFSISFYFQKISLAKTSFWTLIFLRTILWVFFFFFFGMLYSFPKWPL